MKTPEKAVTKSPKKAGVLRVPAMYYFDYCKMGFGCKMSLNMLASWLYVDI